MQIVIDNIEQFKNFFDVVYDSSSEEVELQLFPNRMVCAVLDKTKTRFFRVQFDDEFFNVYAIDEVNSITVNIDDLYKLLKSCNKKDVLYLEVNDPYLVAKVESENDNSRVFEFVLPSDFIESPTLPTIELDAIIECDVGDLKQSVNDISLIGSDKYTFVADGSQLTILTSQEIATKYANTLDVEYEQECDTVSSSFNLQFIKQMLKFDKINKTVKLKIGDNMPLVFSFVDEIMGVSIDGLVAPLLSEEE